MIASASDPSRGLSAHALRHAFAGVELPDMAEEAMLARLAVEARFDLDAASRLSDSGGKRLAVYRAFHARTVRAASPLALDLLRHLGLDPDGVCGALGPDGRWDPWLCGPRPMLARRFAHRWKGRTAPEPDEGHDRAAFLNCGVRLRGHEDRNGALGIRLSPAGLEVAASLGPVRVRTLGGMAFLTTGAEIPTTVRLASVGLELDEIFDHPCFVDRGYAIISQQDFPVRFGSLSRWAVVASTGRVPWLVPWTRASDVGGAANTEGF